MTDLELGLDGAAVAELPSGVRSGHYIYVAGIIDNSTLSIIPRHYGTPGHYR